MLNSANAEHCWSSERFVALGNVVSLNGISTKTIVFLFEFTATILSSPRQTQKHRLFKVM